MTTKEMIEKISLDTSMQEAIAKCTTPKEAYDYAKGQGLTDTIEQFVETMGELKKASAQMSEADVDAVTGGASEVSMAVTAVSVSSAASATAIATASASAACGL